MQILVFLEQIYLFLLVYVVVLLVFYAIFRAFIVNHILK